MSSSLNLGLWDFFTLRHSKVFMQSAFVLQGTLYPMSLFLSVIYC